MSSDVRIEVLPPPAEFRPADPSRQAFFLAELAVLEAIECEGLAATSPPGQAWIDIGPMTDAREVTPRWLDIHRIVLDFALQRGLIERHPKRAHLVRVIRRP